MDTVFEKDSPFQKFVRRGDTVEGPGVDDMKGGLVVMVSALRAMSQAGTLKPADIRIVLSGDEESAGDPIPLARADMVEAGKWADAAMEYEGLAREDNKDVGSIARRGSISWIVTATGKTAHSAGVFGEGVGFGANYELARILDSFRRDLREPNLTYNIGLMLGGVEAEPTTPEAIAGTASGKSNIVAAKAIATGDIRALSNEQAKRIEDRMRAIVADHLPGTDARIAIREAYPAMAPTEGSRALLADLNVVNRDLGLPQMAELDPMKRGAGRHRLRRGRRRRPRRHRHRRQRRARRGRNRRSHLDPPPGQARRDPDDALVEGEGEEIARERRPAATAARQFNRASHL